MPSYKTHSIHGEILYSMIESKVKIDKELLKLFCIGPDALLTTDNKAFITQHTKNTREFFLSMIQMIKDNHQEYNREIMAFLYGQLDHLVVDTQIHPYIYYISKNYPNHDKISTHGLIEMWIDDFIAKEYGKKQSFYSSSIHFSQTLKEFINKLYQKVYGVKNGFTKYDLGLKLTKLFDSAIRRDKTKFFQWVMKNFSIGDVCYQEDYERVKPLLNGDKEVWYNPETNEERTESFEELWINSFEVSKKLIEDVNNHIYYNMELKNPLLQDISYNTGLPCERGQQLLYTKKYNENNL